MERAAGRLQSGRVDFGSLEGPIVGGVWECTPGKFEFNYTADETRLIMGQPSNRIGAILGYVGEEELIHRDNLVLA